MRVVRPTVPLPLEDGSKGPRADPLSQSDLPLRDLPVVAGVPPPQSFLDEGRERRPVRRKDTRGPCHTLVALASLGRLMYPYRNVCVCECLSWSVCVSVCVLVALSCVLR